MKRIQLLTLTLLLASALFLPTKVATAQLKATLEGHTDNVWSVTFSPDGNMLASASWDQTVRVWNVNTGRLLHTLTGHTNDIMSVVFSPDGQTLASGCWDSTIRLWNPHNGNLKRTLTEHAGGVASVVFSPDGQTLASGSADRTIRLWNVTTWKPKRTLTGHTDVVETLTFSPDGATLASGSRDTTIRLWNPNDGRHKRTLTEHTDPVNALAFAPDGETLASGSRDRTIRLWDPNNGREKETLTGYTSWVNPVAFSPDGATLLVGGRGISVWDTETSQSKKPLAGDIGGAISVVFSPDGQMVASGSTDNKVRLWEFNVSDYDIPVIDTNGMVRLFYFLPNDRPARPERIAALRQLMKDTQQFYAEQMESRGFGRKTFSIETDKDGEPIVHHVDGKFTEDYYYEGSTDSKVWEELYEYVDDPQHIYFVAIDLSNETLVHGNACGLGSVAFFPVGGHLPQFAGKISIRHRGETQGEEVLGGSAIIPVSGQCFEDTGGSRHRLWVTTHELGHAFGLEHDFREDESDTVVGGRGYQLSKCDAEWLSVSRFFNTKPISPNTPADIKLLLLRTYNQDVVSLHFEVTDPDGLHHAQLLVPAILGNPEWAGQGAYRLFDCKPLIGKTNTIESTVRTVEIVDRVTLQIMDMSGYITWATFLVNLDEAVPSRNTLDVNSDGIVNVSDLTSIASRYGRRGKNPADVNEDNTVDIVDLLLVTSIISSLPRQFVDTFDATEVQKWLTDANQLGIENESQQKGVVFLQRLLAEIELFSEPIEIATAPSTAIFGNHTDNVWSIAFSPDGQTLASASIDQTIRLWDLQTQELGTTLIENTDKIFSVVFSPDGQTLASTSSKGTIRLWNPNNGKHIKTLGGHKDWVPTLAFSPDGETLASGGAGAKILLWNTDTWQVKETLVQPTHFIQVVAFSPDSQTLASTSVDGTIRLWDPNNGKLKKTLTGHTQTVKSLAFSPDGETLASGGRDRTIRLWNPKNGREKKTLTGYTDWINPVAFSPDGTILASGNGHAIRLWNTQTGEHKSFVEGHTGHILSVAFSPDGETLASSAADTTVRLWDFQTPLEQSPTLADKITGPWLWMIASTKTRQGGANSINVDSLYEASGGNVTEAHVATDSAREGDAVGNRVWTLGKIAETGWDNVNQLVNEIGFGKGDVNDHSSYALITLESATAQSNVTMQAGSDDSIKIWLNGEVVHNNPINQGAEDYKDKFTVDLKKGDNLLLVKVGERDGGWSMFVGIDADVNAVYKRPPDPVTSVDVNADGVVNILDLLLVSANFGETGQNTADVNGDGIVNIADLLKVASEIGTGAAAPAAYPQVLETLTAADVHQWLTQAQHADLTDATSQRGILMLEQLLAALIPKETSLLPNYPNPFNPETWIPYQLAQEASVTLTIYTADGKMVRALALGQQHAGIYQSKSRAAYWDGKNEVGEHVASGLYFYTLTTGDFTATRKMLIRK